MLYKQNINTYNKLILKLPCCYVKFVLGLVKNMPKHQLALLYETFKIFFIRHFCKKIKCLI